METKPSNSYMERIDALDKIVRDCIEVSQRLSGIPSLTGSHYYASLLFTSLCTRGVSLLILAPYSSWSEKKVEHWDYSTLAVIVRSILEIRLTLYYLCIEECHPIEWDCRWNIFNLHDCESRIRLFKGIDKDSQDINGFEAQAEEIRSRLIANLYFMNLPLTGKKRRGCPS